MAESDPFKWRHYQDEIILLCVRWYLRYALSFRNMEEMMRERGLALDHMTIYQPLYGHSDVFAELFSSPTHPLIASGLSPGSITIEPSRPWALRGGRVRSSDPARVVLIIVNLFVFLRRVKVARPGPFTPASPQSASDGPGGHRVVAHLVRLHGDVDVARVWVGAVVRPPLPRQALADGRRVGDAPVPDDVLDACIAASADGLSDGAGVAAAGAVVRDVERGDDAY